MIGHQESENKLRRFTAVVRQLFDFELESDASMICQIVAVEDDDGEAIAVYFLSSRLRGLRILLKKSSIMLEEEKGFSAIRIASSGNSFNW
mmetsp:Transcript_16592/g.36074  ORF Transcript_16592/g.36074 Transcript_16592/m.36074 type:complete len:91 (-) Transcript_16592:432-704(-)